jgi:hypothetical protein
MRVMSIAWISVYACWSEFDYCIDIEEKVGLLCLGYI